MKARLLAKSGPLQGSSFEIGDEATIGRIEENDVVLPSDLVSRRHARIYFDAAEGQYFIEDLGSANGVRVAGVRVRQPERLGPIELVSIAEKLDFIFQVPVGRTAAQAEPARPAETNAAAAVPVAVAAGPPRSREAGATLERTVLEPTASLPAALAGGGSERTIVEPASSLPAPLAGGGSSERTLAEDTLAMPEGWKGDDSAGVHTAIVDGLPAPPDHLLRPGSVPTDATVIESEPPMPPAPPRPKRD